MNSDIVRVIRRGQVDLGKCLHREGVVEGAEICGRQASHSATGLGTILAGAWGGSKRPGNYRETTEKEE